MSVRMFLSWSWLLVLLLSAHIAWGGAIRETSVGPPPIRPTPPPIHRILSPGHAVYLPLLQAATAPAPWVDTWDREASRRLYQVAYRGSAGADIGWTGNHAACDPGETGPEFRAAMARRINYFRSMAGVPPIRLNPGYNTKAQHAALLMSANRALSHTPSTDWSCYRASGEEGAGSSNLFLGVYGPQAISGYIYDPGEGNYPVGHRRWILYPQTRQMGTGDIPPRDGYPAANALWVFDRDAMWGPRPQTRDDFVAWPPPGYVPYPVVYPRWSLSYPNADFTQATVTMAQDGQALAVQVHPPVDGYGENTLVWEPQARFDTASNGEIRYQVRIDNVWVDGRSRTFTYTVIVFDPGP